MVSPRDPGNYEQGRASGPLRPRPGHAAPTTHGTPYSAATSDNARADTDAADSNRDRNRPVKRYRRGICTDRSTSTRWTPGVPRRGSGFRHRAARAVCPQALHCRASLHA